jgi:surfeit locus 1 family protein
MNRGIGGFRPRLVPTLITLPVVLLCLALGLWQVQRLHWKEGLIAQRAAALAAPPVAPPQTLAAARRLELRRIVAAGVFLDDKEILLHAIAPDGAAGFDVFSPLRESGSSRLVFVDRGFVPTTLKERAARGIGQPAGTARIAGRLLLPTLPGLFVPDNRPASGEWFRIDLGAMAKADGIGDVAPFYIAADATPNPGGWPKGGTALPELPNHHLQYAITWFSLAAAGLVIYFLSQRQPAGGKDERIRET